MDGVYARLFSRASSFGAFIDSNSDRYADMFILSGIGMLYAQKFAIGYLILMLIIMIDFVMVSYTKTREESIISKYAMLESLKDLKGASCRRLNRLY